MAGAYLPFLSRWQLMIAHSNLQDIATQAKMNRHSIKRVLIRQLDIRESSGVHFIVLFI